jgi:hypothetical protein
VVESKIETKRPSVRRAVSFAMETAFYLLTLASAGAAATGAWVAGSVVAGTAAGAEETGAAGTVAAAVVVGAALASAAFSRVKRGKNGVISRGIFSRTEVRAGAADFVSSTLLVQGFSFTRPPRGNAAI